MATAAKLEAIRALVGAAPDAVLSSLAMALSGGGPDLGQVEALVTQEQAARRLRGVVFAPILPLFSAREDGVRAPRFPRELMKDLWRALTAAEPKALEAAARQLREWDGNPPAPECLDTLCLAAADLCEAGAGGQFQGQDAGASARELTIYLRLSPFARPALARLGDWLGKATEERAAVLRLLFKDAAEVCDDSAPRMMEMLLGHLPEASLVLRPIALITERAGDRYLASSELASFGERLIEQVEARVERLRGFDLRGGAPAAMVAAADVQAAGALLTEIEHSVDLARDGPWGKRIAAARKSMAAMIESRLRECQKAVEAALPMQAVRLTGRMTRPSPKVSTPPDPRHVEPAKALMLLLGETRQAANTGGFGALRTQVAEGLSDWLEVYADELVHLINAGEAPDVALAHAYLELAADFLAQAENEKAAQIVRRRAAVAGAGSPSQDVA